MKVTILMFKIILYVVNESYNIDVQNYSVCG